MLTELVELPGGSFRMGSTSFYPEEAPIHTVTVAAFAIERHPVTNAQFAEFVDDTGYVTVAEQATRSRAVSRASTPRTWCPARWCSGRRPGRWTCGTGGSGGTGRPARAGVTRSARTAAIDDRPDHPVVQVAYPDAAAYAALGGPAAADRGRMGVRGARRQHHHLRVGRRRRRPAAS